MRLPKITNENMHIFIPHKVVEVARISAQKNLSNITEELLKFYQSDVYRLLENEKTKLWCESPKLIYGLYKEELN